MILTATRPPGGRRRRSRKPWELGAPCSRMDIVRALIRGCGEATRSLGSVGEASWFQGRCVGENRSLRRRIRKN